MKRLDSALNTSIASDITFLLGRTISIFRDFKAHPGLYEKLGIPWYKDVLDIAEYTIIILFVKSANIIGSLKRNALTLQDGTAVDILSSDPGFQWTYRLPDGTELLRARAPFDDPVNACVNGDEAFGTLSDKARKKILAYYAEQKPLYDERKELEKCYAEWKKLGENYSVGYIQQNVWLTAYNEQVLYFKTLAELPGGECADISLGTAFDRESGEKLDNWDWTMIRCGMSGTSRDSRLLSTANPAKRIAVESEEISRPAQFSPHTAETER